MSLLSVNNLRVGFAPDYRSILQDIDFELDKGEILGLCGESGCGKSITALALLNLLPETATWQGQIALAGESLEGASESRWQALRGREISMIFQDAQQALNPLQRIGVQVGESLLIHHPELSARERKARVLEMLRRVQLDSAEEIARAFPHELSGGQRQRVLCAMALINHPKILVADEPTTALDLSVQEKLLDLLRSFRDQEGLSMLFISHDIRVVRKFCDRVLIYYAGTMVEEGPVEEVFGEAAHPYTRLLLQAMPSRSPKGQSLVEIKGRVPSSAVIAAHHARPNAPCIFAARCPLATEICHRGEPPREQLGERHFARCFRARELSESAAESDCGNTHETGEAHE